MRTKFHNYNTRPRITFSPLWYIFDVKEVQMETYHINLDVFSLDEDARDRFINTVRNLEQFDVEDLEFQFYDNEDVAMR